ncbi:MAG: hypothetical protein IK073_03860 [Paludibacteraceae bacterium]|nr:hypothetical protein [Paludibacteraceae bacterium]
MRRLWVILLLSIVCPMAAQQYERPDDKVCRIAFWNLENLFHPGQDSINRDSDYTPDGIHHWTLSRYYRKLTAISRALSYIGGWQGLDMIGVCEVENDTCLIHLTRRMPGYRFVHYDSPDRRGIDCGLLYHTTRISVLNSRAVPVPLDSLARTRDLLYVCAQDKWQDTLHIIVAHLPSQWSGQAASEWKRRRAKQVIQTLIDSIYAICPAPRIVVMGDMNAQPQEDIRGMRNLALQLDKSRWEGTHKYRNRWTTLDQFYVSPQLPHPIMRVMDIDMLRERDPRYLGYRPHRTFRGVRYDGGVSDHFPILLELQIEK